MEINIEIGIRIRNYAPRGEEDRVYKSLSWRFRGWNARGGALYPLADSLH